MAQGTIGHGGNEEWTVPPEVRPEGQASRATNEQVIHVTCEHKELARERPMTGKKGLQRESGKRMGGRGPETARSGIRRALYSPTPLGYRGEAYAGPFLPASRESEVGDWLHERVGTTATGALAPLPAHSVPAPSARPSPFHRALERAALSFSDGDWTP